MKTLLLLSISLFLIGCKKAPDEGDVGRLTTRLKMEGHDLAMAEYGLKKIINPGEVALELERLKERKAMILEIRERKKDTIPMNESEGIVEQARKDSFEILTQAVEREKTWYAGVKRDSSEKLDDIERKSKQNQAEIDLNFQRERAALELKIAKERLNLARIEAGQDPESFRPAPQAKPSSDPNLPPGMERADKAAMQPIEVGD